MGHQVNFHATPADIGELEASIRALEPLLVLHDRSSSAKPRVLPSLRLIEQGQPLLYYWLVRSSDLSDVVTRHVPAQGYWVVDVVRSPVVELDSCFFDGQILRRGRVYYVDGFHDDNGEWVEKPETFRRWARGVLKVTRKSLQKHGADYIGRDASAWLQRGDGKLVT